MFDIEAIEACLPTTEPRSLKKALPAIVWRSDVKRALPGVREPTRLHLVTAASQARRNRLERRRRERIATHTRFIEGACLAAALGTALVIWWSAR